MQSSPLLYAYTPQSGVRNERQYPCARGVARRERKEKKCYVQHKRQDTGVQEDRDDSLRYGSRSRFTPDRVLRCTRLQRRFYYLQYAAFCL